MVDTGRFYREHKEKPRWSMSCFGAQWGPDSEYSVDLAGLSERQVQ